MTMIIDILAGTMAFLFDVILLEVIIIFGKIIYDDYFKEKKVRIDWEDEV